MSYITGEHVLIVFMFKNEAFTSRSAIKKKKKITVI